MTSRACLATVFLWLVSCSACLAQSLSQEWAADWSAKKLEAVLALYAPDAVFLPTIGPRWQGLAVLRKSFAGILANYNPRIALKSINFERSGDLAYDSGTYEETITPMKGGKPVAAKGGYLFLFQRNHDGRWMILEQSWSSFGAPPNL